MLVRTENHIPNFTKYEEGILISYFLCNYYRILMYIIKYVTTNSSYLTG